MLGFHIVKRKNMEWWKAWLVRIGSILLGALVCAAVTVFLTGKDPVNVFSFCASNDVHNSSTSSKQSHYI